ncbi:MAG: hypothetical protein P1P84_01445 [Deferrisomatales bacterium]|nr:hypothetical protein [Deferrisomatales bacterium]
MRNDGLINVYQLTTDYGPVTAESTAALQARVAELSAMATMEEMDRSEVFTDSLVKGAKGTVRGAAAHLATSSSVARFYRLTAQMMAGYHRNVAPVERVVNVAGRPMARRKDGGLVLLAAVDYVFWTKDVAAKVDMIDRSAGAQVPAVSGKELWLTGEIDGAARTELEARGWRVTPNANSVLLKEG